MRTREESLIRFCEEVDTLINSKYLFASSSVFNLITVINSSKLLTDTFNYFVNDFDFERTLTSSLIEENGEKFFVLPSRDTDAISLIYLLLKEINYKHLQLTDLLDYFDGGKNYEVAYKNFAKEVLLPFKNSVYQIGLKIINSTHNESEAVLTKSKVSEEPISQNNNEQIIKVENPTTTNKYNVEGIDNITLLRLIDLDNLAINQSKISKDDKSELLYVLKIFEECVRENNDDKIKLSYLAYYYAMRTYSKIKSNLKDITRILIERKII